VKDQLGWLGVAVKSYSVMGSLTGSVSSLGGNSIDALISVTAPQPLSIVVRSKVVKNGARKLILPLAHYRHNPETYELLGVFVGEFVNVHVIELGVYFTTTLLKWKGRDYIYVNVPSRLKQFFLPAWQEDKPLTVLVTIDPRLLQNTQG
jgi:hypothetical protein